VKAIVLPSGEIFSVSREGYTGGGEIFSSSEDSLAPEVLTRLRRLGSAGVLCNEGQLTCEKGTWTYHGDAVDIALLALGYKLSLDPPRMK